MRRARDDTQGRRWSVTAMDKKTIRDVDVAGKRVLLRVDFNVPMDSDTGAVTDDSRIRAALPTIGYLREREARLILCSHLGRPQGPDPKLSLAPVGRRLAKLLGADVPLASDCIGPEAVSAGRRLEAGAVLMLENLRFHPEEEANDPQFAGALASLAELYVNDAFGAAHRAHASTEGVAHCLPAVAGLLMEAELRFLGMALSNPERPMAAVVGGAKIGDKIAMLESMIDRVQALLIGGGMAATFLKAKGHQVGKSLLEPEKVEVAARLEGKAKANQVAFLLPLDLVVAQQFDAEAPARTVPAAGVVPDGVIMDIGPQTVALFQSELRKCRTALWNGPMGVFEMPRFAHGTRGLAECLAGLNATTIVGGGSTAQAVNELGLADRMSHVSTGGGASLELLEGKTLPGVAALMDK